MKRLGPVLFRRGVAFVRGTTIPAQSLVSPFCRGQSVATIARHWHVGEQVVNNVLRWALCRVARRVQP